MSDTGVAEQEKLASDARCLKCRYPLQGLIEHRCPECGTAFDPAKPDTYRVPAENPEAHPPGSFGIFIVCACVVASIYDTSYPFPFGIGWCFAFVAIIAAVGEYAYRVIENIRTKFRGDLFSANQHLAKTRWFLLPFGLILLGLTIETKWPLYVRFALSRDAMTRVAQRVLAAEKFDLGPQWIGLYRVEKISNRNGTIRFQTGVGVIEPVGFCYQCGSCVDNLSDDWCSYKDD